MLVFVFPVLGGLAGVLFIRLLGFRKFHGGDLLLGFAVFFISIFIQQPIQQLPLLYLLFSNGLTVDPVEIQGKVLERITAQNLLFTLAISIWLGFVAALVQSGFKYLFVRNKSYVTSMNVGAGFGLMEAFFVGITGLITQLFAGQVVKVPFYYYVVSGIERFSALLFHAGSTLYLYNAWSIGRGLKGFAVIVVVHGFIDTLAACYQFTGDVVLLVFIEILVLAIGLLLTLKLYKKTLVDKEDGVPW
ncbi:MAG: YhfC family glutamic-type intramembrane protease [Desulfurococcaceae archaeon]